jgi:hypothetical protein
MDPWIANPPVFGEVDLSYSIQSPYGAQQAYQLYGSHLALDNLSSQTLPTDGQVITGHNNVLHSLQPSLAHHIHTPYNTESFGGTETIPVIHMGPPTKLPRKKKAPTLRAGDWEPYKARIIELHITQKLPLPEVQKKIEEEFGFTAVYVFPSCQTRWISGVIVHSRLQFKGRGSTEHA